jgi:hypothetical protein
MKRIVLALVLLAGCRSAPVVREGTQVTGAATPRAAVEGMLAAVRQQDVQALGSIWGDARGSAREVMEKSSSSSNPTMTRDDYEKRVILLQCYLMHDEARITGGPTTKLDTVSFNLELRKGQARANLTARTLPGPASRWYVLDMAPLPQSWCNRG